MDAVVDLDNSLVKDEVEEVPVEPPVKRVRRLNSRKKVYIVLWLA
jgi:hypothetical protein